MVSIFSSENIIFTNNIYRPSTTKGTVMGHNGIEIFDYTTPSSDNQVLISDDTETAGIKWASDTSGAGFGFATHFLCPDPGGSTAPNPTFYIVDANNIAFPRPRPVVMPRCTAVYMSVGTSSNSGWAFTPANITGGTIDFTLGYNDMNAQPSASTFTDYPGGPHLSISGSDLSMIANRFNNYYLTLNIDILEGQQVAVRIDDNLTTSGLPIFQEIRTFILFRGS